MTNEEVVQRVKEYQNNEYVKPLTCPDHHCTLLFPLEQGSRVVLVCLIPGCGFVRQHIPEFVLHPHAPAGELLLT